MSKLVSNSRSYNKIVEHFDVLNIPDDDTRSKILNQIFSYLQKDILYILKTDKQIEFEISNSGLPFTTKQQSEILELNNLIKSALNTTQLTDDEKLYYYKYYHHYFENINNDKLKYLPINLFQFITTTNIYRIKPHVDFNFIEDDPELSYNAIMINPSKDSIETQFKKFLKIVKINNDYLYDNVYTQGYDTDFATSDDLLRKLNIPEYGRVVQADNLPLTQEEKNIILSKIKDPNFDNYSYADMVKMVNNSSFTKAELDEIYSKINEYKSELFDKMIKARNKDDLATYNQIKQLFKETTLDMDNIYSEIMSKEEKVLEMANNLAKKEQELHNKNKYFLDNRLSKTIKYIFITLQDLLEFLTNSENVSFNEFLTFIKQKHRIIYLGIFIVILAFIFNFMF
jgi:hypothetical protein